VSQAFHYPRTPTKLIHWNIAALSLLVSIHVVAQTAARNPVALYPANKGTASFRKENRKNGRFLGWNFAALSGEDTKKWERNRAQTQPLTAVNGASRSIRRVGGTPGPGGFANAGFEARPSLPAGYIPTAITNGDFNGDGKMDFAVSNGGDNTIYVFLGNGDGTFQVPEILYTQGQSPDWITAVKLRKNGHIDLAVTDADSNTVEVFLGNGDGTFQPSSQTSLPQIPTFILATDVNNDGKQDLVIGLTIAMDSTQPQFEVLLGNGSGGFSSTLFSQAIYGNPDGPIPTGWIAAGDLNNDGYVDLVVTITGGAFIPYLSQSGTSFPFSNYMGFNDGPLVVGLGDMNEDGCLDAVQLGNLGLLTIAEGTCDGNFAQDPNPTAMVGDMDPAIQVVDVNGDGHLDVVGSAVLYILNDNLEAGTSAGYLVSVLDGDGKGDLGLAQVYRGGTDAYSLIVADFNGDNRPEILTTSSLENQVSLFTNDGSGNYGPPQGETVGYTFGPVNAPDHLAPLKVADLNGDGKPDLLLIEFNEEPGGFPELTAILNDGTGKFLPPVRSLISIGDAEPIPTYVVGAFRNAATPDLIYINTYTGTNSVFYVAFFAGNGNGTFNSPVTLTTLPNPQQVVAGDFNNDGKLDFAVMGTDVTGEQWEFDVFLGHGDGTFAQQPAQLFPILATDPPQQLFALDLNHDGKLDLLLGVNTNNGAGANADLIEVLGNGNGTFQTPTILISEFGAAAVADVNNDGYPDLIQNLDPNGDFGESGLFYQAGITVYLGSANGTFQQQPSYDLPGVTIASFNPAIVGDFNGDGIPDIAVRYWPAQPPVFLVEPSLAILQGVGDGTFIVTGQNYQLQAESYPLVGADFNGDGATDLVEVTGETSSFTTIPAAGAPALSIALAASPILGSTGQATVTLDLPATSSQTVALSASDKAIQIPASITFTTGQQTQNVSFTLGSGFDATHVFALYATLGAQTALAYGTKPNPNLTVGISASVNIFELGFPRSNVDIEPGESFRMLFALASEGGYSGSFSSLQCNGLPAGVSCSFAAPSLLILPGGSESVVVTFNTSTSTPLGTQNVTVSSSDGSLTGAASFQLSFGDFSLSLSPTPIVLGPAGAVWVDMTATSINGLSEPMTITCSGLPAQIGCAGGSNLGTGGPVGLTVVTQGATANDYPFQIIGTADIVSHSVSATLRVGDYSASLDKTTATLSAGQSATFNLTLTSLNHYSSTITLYCGVPPATTLTCAVSSPIALTDSGTATMQLTVTDPAKASSIHPAWRPSGGDYLLASLLPLSLLLVRKKRNFVLGLVLAAGLAALISCGGSGSAGSSSGSGGGGGTGGGGGGGGGGTTQTFSFTVTAQAAETQSDSNNQKSLGPIVITLN
jgi:FG-GAP-like repeat